MMRVLLDTHLVLDLLQQGTPRYRRLEQVLGRDGVFAFVSVASLWEIAIKTRLGKLEISIPLDLIPRFLAALEIGVLPIDIRHVITRVSPEPVTRDPFDRLLLAICQADSMRLATLDRALVDHPLAFEHRF